MQNNRERAKRLLVHYFGTVWPRERFNWDGDNVVEIEEIVDLIIEAAVERLEEKRD